MSICFKIVTEIFIVYSYSIVFYALSEIFSLMFHPNIYIYKYIERKSVLFLFDFAGYFFWELK